MQTFSQIVKKGKACTRSKGGSMRQASREEEEAPGQEIRIEIRRKGAVRDSVYRREKRGGEKKKSKTREH